MDIKKSKEYPFLDEFPCPIETIFRLVGGKWRTRIIWEIGNTENSIRFNDLVSRLSGISPKVLSNELSQLEEMNILTRQDFNEFPPRVEYKLAAFGESLQPVFAVSLQWVDENIDEVRRIFNES
jgi:DNA-binding HxlR family transcriptional regulator